MINESRAPLPFYRGFPVENKYAWSAFVTKLEFRLRYSKLQYNIQEGTPSEGPNGKIPYVDIAPLKTKSPTAGPKELVGDSTIIARTFIGQGLLPDLNASLSPEKQVSDLGIRALLEDKLYFFNTCERWIDNFYVQRDGLFKSKPWPIRFIIGTLIHRKIVQTVHLQGCGRFTKAEQKDFRHEILQTLEDVLAVKLKENKSPTEPFWVLGGAQATEGDFVLYAFINSNLVCTSCPDSTSFTRSLPSMMDYAGRIHDTYFPDYEKW